MKQQWPCSTCLLWPFGLVLRVLKLGLALARRLLLVILGLGLIAGGILISLTIIGLVVGVPAIILGVLLLIRAVF